MTTSMAAPRPPLPTLAFETAATWDRWLEREHATSRGLWLKLAKKGTGLPSVDYAGALDVALTWGWIDGQKAALDEVHWLQKFTPRGPKSLWSKVNREHIARLELAGRMKPAGQAAVAAAQADGRWAQAYDSPARATVPEDLARALERSRKAAQAWAGLDAANRYAVLHRVLTAKKAETRARRIETLVAMLARGETIHPRRTPRPRPGA
jgi:uncharacterized protein YdeI (YjbR/CyaY-like superfamily)